MNSIILKLTKFAFATIASLSLIYFASAFKNKQTSESAIVTASFILTGSNPLASGSYEHAPAPPTCQTGVEEICYIEAEVANPGASPNDWLPLMTDELKDEIEEIFNTPVELRNETDNVKLRDL